MHQDRSDQEFDLWIDNLSEGERIEVATLLRGFQQAAWQMRGMLSQYRHHPGKVDTNPAKRQQAQETLLRIRTIAERLGELGWPEYDDFTTHWDQDLAALVIT